MKRRTVRHTRNRSTSTPAIAPRLLRRADAAAYLNVSLSAFDSIRKQFSDELRPVPVPRVRGIGGHDVQLVASGETLRTPLFDIRDLDRLIDAWKAQPCPKP